MASSTPSHEKQKRGGAMSTYKYNPSSGRHLKPESKPVTTMADKTHALRNWFNLSMRKPKPSPEIDVVHCDEKRKQSGNVTYSLDGNFGNGRRGGGGGGEVMVVEAARKSVSHVEANLASVASFLQVKVLASDMPGFMQVHAFRSARRTYDSLEKFSSKHMAYNLKKPFSSDSPAMGPLVIQRLPIDQMISLDCLDLESMNLDSQHLCFCPSCSPVCKSGLGSCSSCFQQPMCFVAQLNNL